MEPDDEDQQLRSVALQNAHSILQARQRAEDELLRTKAALRAAGNGTFRWNIPTTSGSSKNGGRVCWSAISACRNADGFERLRRVRALGAERGGKVPAIALTAFARSEDRTRALRAGFLVHVAKPVDPSELVATVSTVAGRIDEQRG